MFITGQVIGWDWSPVVVFSSALVIPKGLPKAFPLATFEKRETPQRKKSISFGDPQRAIPLGITNALRCGFVSPFEQFGFGEPIKLCQDLQSIRSEFEGDSCKSFWPNYK